MSQQQQVTIYQDQIIFCYKTRKLSERLSVSIGRKYCVNNYSAVQNHVIDICIMQCSALNSVQYQEIQSNHFILAKRGENIYKNILFMVDQHRKKIENRIYMPTALKIVSEGCFRLQGKNWELLTAFQWLFYLYWFCKVGPCAYQFQLHIQILIFYFTFLSYSSSSDIFVFFRVPKCFA